MEISGIFFALLLVNFTIVLGENINRAVLENRILKTLLSAGPNDHLLRPPRANASENEPVDVRVNVYVRKVIRIDHVKNEYEVQLTFRQQWNDDRLKYDDYEGKVHFVIVNDVHRFWMPDLFFSDERQGNIHDLIVPNSFIRIFPNGDIMFSMRISLTLTCPMNLRRYPFDTQVCPLKVASYGYTTEDVVLRWKEEDPVQATTLTSITGFILDGHTTDSCTSNTKTGEYGCVVAHFNFKRLSFHYLLHIYLPLALLVAASWISFWLSASSILSRLTISIGTSFCILLQLYSNSIHFFSLYYVTALDIWAAICCASVFGALVENLYVDYSHIKRVKAVPSMEEGGEGKGNRTEAEFTTFKFLWAKASGQTPKIDVISRVVFPLFFVLTNVIYWPLLI